MKPSLDAFLRNSRLLTLTLCAALIIQPLAASTTFPEKTWATATPETYGIDSAKLDAAMAYLGSSFSEGVEEALVIKDGHVIWEGEQINKLHSVWSCTKSFALITTGLLYDDGVIDYDTRLADLVPAYEEYYPELRVRHVLTLTDGFGGHQPGKDYLPNPPLFAPGEYFHYAPGMVALSRAMTVAADEELSELFRRRIANEIGLTNWQWGNEGIMDEYPVSGFGGKPTNVVQISANSMGRVGLLLLNKGNWNGKQLLSEEWIANATQPQAGLATPLYQPEAWYAAIHGAYGNLFWVNAVRDDGELMWPDAPASTFALQGNKNNLCFVIPEWDMVVVRLGTDKVGGGGVYANFFTYLKMAIDSTPKP